MTLAEIEAIYEKAYPIYLLDMDALIEKIRTYAVVWKGRING